MDSSVKHNKTKRDDSKVKINKQTQHIKPPSKSRETTIQVETDVGSFPNVIESAGEKEKEFILVKNKKSRRSDRTIVGSGKAEEMSIKGVPKYGYLHVCKLDPTLKSEMIIKHLNKKGFTGILCEKLESKRPGEYSSFKITVPADKFEALKSPDLWPEGSRLNHFLFRLNRGKIPNTIQNA